MIGFGWPPAVPEYTPPKPVTPRVQPTREEVAAMALAGVRQASQRHQEAVQAAMAADDHNSPLVNAVMQAGEDLDRAIQSALQHGHTARTLAGIEGLHPAYVDYLTAVDEGRRPIY